ncbi:MAG: TauD/TfdA family dioxygenase, partial [Candidatus Latescibacterota bacterium]|nr:TauD/TfdA family dioxygenase [Candidatus Latescibacterota bacterium]
AYWALGQCLGEPLEQNVEGDLLYDVRDTGRDVAEGARFSVTNAESTFHIDSAFSPQIPDYVGLFCLRPARTGGQSQLVSACALHDALLEECPEVLDALYGDFCFDRRGQCQVGEDPVHRAPIFAWDGRELTMRYLRYYIEVGHERAGVPQNAEQTRALAAVEGLLQRPEFRVEFALEPGQMLFANNHWILHNRTAFEDFAEPELRRHYVRLWLGRRGD